MVIVDPRSTDVFYHEIGHLIFDRQVSITVPVHANDSESFAQSLFSHATNKAWA
ncbi:MAG: hypothetical protein JWN70_6066 [Planctomycetaceae bacterium]|nr:hypothetical protein [Planctomycetaceae bacterium]